MSVHTKVVIEACGFLVKLAEQKAHRAQRSIVRPPAVAVGLTGRGSMEAKVIVNICAVGANIII